jgi:putative endonuclease
MKFLWLQIPVRLASAGRAGSIPGEATTAFPVFYTYVLKSTNHNYYYKGHCRDPEKRLCQHNLYSLTLIYLEAFESEQEAIEREKCFKSAAGGRYLKKILPS